METAKRNERVVVTVRQDFSTEENAFVPIDEPFEIDWADLEVIDGFVQLQIENNNRRIISTLVHNRRAIIGKCERKSRRVFRLNIPPFCGDLPKSVLRLDALETLNLRFCENIPPWIGRFKHLKKLFLPESTAKIPDEIGELTGLIELDLCRSKIASLPPSIGRLGNLKKLNLSHTRKLLTLPEEIGNLGNLVQLQLGESSINTFPSSIGRLKNLKELNLSMANYLSGLPDEIGSLCNLVKLNLCNTPISSLPSSIASLTSLEELDLCGTWKLVRLPEEIGNLENLTRLALTFSPIASLPSSIGKLDKLQELVLSNTESLSSLPEELGGMINLFRLKLNQSSISSLPSSIGKLQNLDELDLCHTERLSHLPEEIGDLIKLRNMPIFGSNILRVAKQELWCKMSLRRARLRISLRPAIDTESLPMTLKIRLSIMLENAAGVFNGKWIEVWPGEFMEPFAAHDAIYQLLVDNGDSYLTSN